MKMTSAILTTSSSTSCENEAFRELVSPSAKMVNSSSEKVCNITANNVMHCKQRHELLVVKHGVIWVFPYFSYIEL